MANNSPTLVMASLSDDQLKKSIESLVTHVDEAMKKMVQSTNNAVGEMEAKLKSLGNLKIDSGGTNDGGASKRAKAQNAETDAIDKAITARGKQIKQNQEAAMSFDQIAAALDKARRTVSDFNTKRASGILPSSEDYKRYEQALARIVEYNDKLKQSALTRADANQWANAFDGKRVVSDLTAVDDRLKQLNNEYKKLEAESKKAFGQDLKDAFKLPTTSLDEVVKKISKLRELSFKGQDQGFISQSQIKNIDNVVIKLRELRREMESKAVPQSVANYIKKVGTVEDQLKLAFARANKIQTDQIDLAQAKLERLQALLRDMRERGILSNTQIASTEAEIRKLEQMIGRVGTAQQQVTSSTQQTTQSAQRYTEEIRKQAQAIRESQQWKEKGFVTINGVDIYNLENSTKRRISLEEQLVALLQEEKTATSQVAQEQLNVAKNAAATNEQLEKARALSNKGIGTAIGEKNGSIPTFTTQLESANVLSKRLKELKEQYNSLSYGKRLGSEGQAIAQQIREITRQGQKLNNELNRPTKKEVFGLSEKTIDDIAYKMRQLSAYRGGLDASKQSREITQVNDEYNRLKKRMDEVMQKNQQMIASNTALGRSWNYMKNRLAFYFTVGASTSFIKNLIEVRSQYEMNERALGILVNSAERGTQIFNELSQMALVSPYTLIELSAAAKQLTAYDVAAKDVVDTTRRLADMAAAVGIPIERLTYALGQIKAYGYLNARDARMFANAGIPLVKQLSEYYTELEGRLVSTADIYDRIKKKSIGYEEVTSVIAKMTDEGGKFYDFQAKMAETLKVQLANLTLAWNNMLNAMGEESQGVLVGGISTLKQLFLHWKDIEHVLYELVAALGAYKAYQIITTRLMGATAASLDAQVLAMKRNKAAMLEKQALTRRLTIDELRQVAAQNQVTAADYRNALSGKQLTKQKALLLAAIYKNNVQLKAALVNMGLLTTAEAASITRGKALAIVFKSIGISIRNAALAIKSFMMSNWLMFAIAGAYELIHAYTSANEHIEEINKQAAEHAKEAFDNIKQYLESESTINTRQRVVYKEGNPLTDAESQKAWDEMREKIELSSSASNTFIAKLMQINDINSRLAAGFDYLRDVQRVAGVMQTLEEDAVKISSTSLGGLFGEGLKDDLKDFIDAYEKYASLSENLKQGAIGEDYFKDQKNALKEFREEVEETTNSIYDIASKEGFNTNEQREFFEREISEIAQAEQMGAKETRIFRMQAEKEYYAYARAQLVAQLEYQDGAQKALTQKRINDLDNEFGTNKALQESFFTWLTEKQDHAVKNMLRGKTQEEIKQGEWLKGSNAKWVEEMARKFSKEYGVSFDDLHRLVLNANTWSINIPVFFQTIGQPLSDVQRDYEARTGKKFSSNPLIKDAKTQVEILDILKKKQKEVANEMATAEKAGGKYWENNKERYKKENDALVADIHAYNALTDAEEKANKKSGKGGSKKDPLLDALKQEISLVEKLQSDYDKLSKSGASQSDALDTIRGAYGKTIRLLNTQLQSYGLPQIDISQLITGKDPHKTLEHFKNTLNTLVDKGILTLERSNELEAVIEKLTLSAKTYDLDKITKGLNSELDRLKEEYELAVAIDADPELGNLFADWMGIDMSALPHTAEEYAKRMTKALNVYLADEKSGIEIDNLLALTDDDLRMFQQRVDNNELTQAWVDNIVKNTKKARNALKKENSGIAKEWDSLIQKYAEYEYKIAQVQRNANKERKAFALKYGTKDQKERALVLTTEIDAEEDQAKKQELINQLKQLLTEIAGDDDSKLKIPAAIDKKELEEGAKKSFEEFQKSPEWIVATGDLAGMTTKAIGGLIDSIEDYKKKAKNLDPKQVKNINNALRKLYKQQREGNPFLAISNAIDQAKSRMEDIQPALDSTMSDIIKLEKEIGNTEPTEEQAKALDKLKKKWKELYKAGQLSASDIVSGINSAIDVAVKASESFNKMAEALGGTNMTKAAKTISDITGNLQAAGQGAAAGAQISGNGWGAAIGATVGGLTDLVTRFAEQWSGNKSQTERVKEVEDSVGELELAYIDLEHAVDKAMGTAVIGAKQVALANKQAQLEAIKRQLELEKERDSKYRDSEKILSLEKQYKELFNEIQDGYTELVDTIMGTDVSSFAENLVSSMITAFKQGEDYMKVFSDKFDEMIDNMIMKSIVSRVVSSYLNKIWDAVDERINNRAKEERDAYKKTQAFSANTDVLSDDELRWNLAWNRAHEKRGNDASLWDARREYGSITEDDIKKYVEAIKAEEKVAKTRLEAATEFTDSDIDFVLSEINETMPELGEKLKSILGQYYKFGESSDKNLSALQQGIQGITEDTAGALEAYMNGVSQQVYLHSDLLTQIRDAVVGIEIDAQIATQAQMLLQLQQSYTVQMAIQGILEGWSSPNGMSVRVEMQ